MKRIVGSIAAALFMAQAATASLAGFDNAAAIHKASLSATSEQLTLDSPAEQTARRTATTSSFNTNFAHILTASAGTALLPEGDAPSTIPEPATIGLVTLLGGALLIGRRVFNL